MNKNNDSFDELVIEELKDPEFAAAYLNEHLAYKGSKRVQLILEALNKLAQARGMETISKKAKMSRRTCYHVLSRSGNPTLETFLKILDAVHVTLRFTGEKSVKKRAAA